MSGEGRLPEAITRGRPRQGSDERQVDVASRGLFSPEVPQSQLGRTRGTYDDGPTSDRPFTEPNRYGRLRYREPNNLMTRRGGQRRDAETSWRIGGRPGREDGATGRAPASGRDDDPAPRAQALAILAIETKTPRRLSLGVSR